MTSDELYYQIEKHLSQPNKKGCALWTGSCTKKGYGRINIRGRLLVVTRVIWWIHNGEPLEEVCHNCDTPPCCEIEHLFTGTTAENAADKMNKGRYGTKKGEANGRAILERNDVALIKGRKGTVPYRIIAEEYGVSIGCIKLIMCGRNWPEVEPVLINSS